MVEVTAYFESLWLVHIQEIEVWMSEERMGQSHEKRKIFSL